LQVWLNGRSQKRNDSNKYQRHFSKEDYTLSNEFSAAATTDYNERAATTAADAGTRLHPTASHHHV